MFGPKNVACMCDIDIHIIYKYHVEPIRGWWWELREGGHEKDNLRQKKLSTG